MIFDDGFCLRWPNHHRVENLWPQYRNASHHRHHDDQCFSGAQSATVWLGVPTVDRCCHFDGWQQQQFLELPNGQLSHSYFLSCVFIDSTVGKLPFCLPFTNKCLSSRKKTFSFHLYFCCLLSKDTGPRKRFDNFHSIFPFRAPLTEMTRLLLVGCFKCTQFNLSFRFTFLLQSRSLLRFGHQLLHNPRSMENRVNFFFTLWSHSCASFDLP